jgi:RNA-splicing ligase RtcB
VLSDFSRWNDLRSAWNELYLQLRGLNKTILGSGNHFIDGCLNQQGQLVILVHLGSRMTTEEKLDFRFERDYPRYWERAIQNHHQIWEGIRAVFGGSTGWQWLCHDTIEEEGSYMLVRKGVTHSKPGEPILIASSFEDLITMGKAKPEVARLKHSMSHGTGRQRSRGEAKEVEFDQQAIRQRVIIPDGLENGSWRLEAPTHYRSSQEVLSLVGEFIEVTDQLLPVAFMGGF